MTSYVSSGTLNLAQLNSTLSNASWTASDSIQPHQSISQLPKLCMKITIFMQGHVLIADWSVAHLVVIMNDVMNDNMAAFAHVGARLGVFFYWTRFLESNVPFDNIPL